MTHLARWQSFVVPTGIIACVLVMMVPLPASVLDLLLAANIAIAVVVLLTTLYINTPLEFNIFPTLLLATTLSRLVLNVASTRLILTQTPTLQLDAAGKVIRAFGEFVTGNNAIVGLVIFAIIIVIQFVVITKGASRVSEVAARFALDGMPGRQMAIDADFNAGAIDQHEAKRRREAIADEADFYGAMDGASKFVRGDAIAGIIITMINIVVGLGLGVFDAGMTPVQAGSLYSKLTIGDGLVSQMPALLISLAAGILVTRSSRRQKLPNEFLRQLFSNPQVLAIAAGFLGILVFTKLPAIPLTVLAVACGGLAVSLYRKPAPALQAGAAQKKTSDQKPAERRVEEFLAVDPMELEIGVGLIRLADPKRGGDLLAKITEVRRAVAADLGIVLPKVRIRDNMQLSDRQYGIKIAGDVVEQGSVYPNKLLAIDNGNANGPLRGQSTSDPGTEQPAVWIATDQLRTARQQGYTPIEPTAVLAGHLQRVVRQHADEILTRDATNHLIEELKKQTPAVVDELIPAVMKIGDVQKVLRALLQESVPIKQLAQIFEVLADNAPREKRISILVELVRQRLARAICQRHRDAHNRLRAITMAPGMVGLFAAHAEQTEARTTSRLSSRTIDVVTEDLGHLLDTNRRFGVQPVVIVEAAVRLSFAELIRTRLPGAVVLSYSEVTTDTTIESVGVLQEPIAAAA